MSSTRRRRFSFYHRTTGGVGSGAGGNESSSGGESVFAKHYHQLMQAPMGGGHGVSLIPLQNVDVDLIQRLHHGCTVIHYDPESGRSVLCHIRLDASCGVLLWQKHHSSGVGSSGWNAQQVGVGGAGGAGGIGSSKFGVGPGIGADGRLATSGATSGPSLGATSTMTGTVATSSAADGQLISARWIARFVAGDIAWSGLEEGYLELSYVKNLELCDMWDFDIEAIYRRHSVEEMSVPMHCWSIVYGASLSENECLYFLAPQFIADTWRQGLEQVVRELKKQNACCDRRLLWLKKLYLDLYFDNDLCVGPTPAAAIQAFGGKAFWREQAAMLNTSSTTGDGGGGGRAATMAGVFSTGGDASSNAGTVLRKATTLSLASNYLKKKNKLAQVR